MKDFLSIAVGICIVIFGGLSQADMLRLNDQPSLLETNYSTDSETRVTLNIGELATTVTENGYKVTLPDEMKYGSGNIPGPGNTLLPTYSTMVAVPADCQLSYTIVNDESSVLDNFELATASDEDADWLTQQVGFRDGKYPEELIRFEYAGKMRDLYLARLTIYPVQYDYENKTLTIHQNIQLDLNHSGGQILPSDRTVSEAFLPVYRSLITNDDILADIQTRRGAYWVIAPSSLVSSIEPLIEWEHAQGYTTRVIPTSEIGSDPNYIEIKDYIVGQYNMAELKPDYICLVGDVSTTTGVDTWSQHDPYGFGMIDSDNYYTFMDDNDYFPDLYVGRISVNYANEVTSYLNKYFQYARTPYMDDTDWYEKAVMVAGSDHQSPRLTKLWCREMLLRNGYTQVDTFVSGYDSPSSINYKINQGTGWVNYRGYGAPSGWSSPNYTTSNVSQLNNSPRYAIMTSIVCGTGDYNYYSDCLGEAWIKLANRGGPGFIGTTNPDTHTQWNNAIDTGIYWAMFMEHTYGLAQLELMGKMNMYFAFPADTYPGGRIEWYFNSYNDLGDPALTCWTGIPKGMNVSHVNSAPIGQCGISVMVTDSQGIPISNAYVCLLKNNDVFDGKFSDADGVADFQVDFESSGTTAVTVTKPQYIPYEGEIDVMAMDIAVGVTAYQIDDDNDGNSSGNGNGAINPTETIELTPILKNFGISQTASNVSAELTTDNPYVDIITGAADFGDIAPGDSASAMTPLVVSIHADAPHNYPMQLNLAISETGGSSWNNSLFPVIQAVDLEFTGSEITGDDNGNNWLERGETGNLILNMHNSGLLDGQGVQAVLRSNDSLVTISDSIGSFGDAPMDGDVSNSADPFTISVASDVYTGHAIQFAAQFTYESGQTQIVRFMHTVDTVTSADPIGPDEYGYYCLDNTDMSYPERPVFNWINIETSWDLVNISDDHIYARDLPFPVVFYGNTFSAFSICDNGYAALGDRWWANFLNTNIPAPQCAPAMLAPFWDDLSSNGYPNGPPLPVRYHYDEANGMFIIGWANARSNDTFGYQDFEIIILDTDQWPTRTGDNDIIFQYNRVTSPYSATVGICSEDQSDGLQYVFNNTYTPGAAQLVAGRAIKFTTGSEYFVGIDGQAANSLPSTTSLAQNYPNPFNPSTTISYAIGTESDVRLDIYDILGRNVRTLVDRHQQAGNYSVIWDSKDEAGQPVAAGVYLYKLQAGDTQEVNKMILLK